MRLLLFSLSFMAIWATSPSCLAQKPAYDVTILADGKPIDVIQGISLNVKIVKFTGQLTPESLQQYPQFKPTVLIKKAILNLVRETRRVGFVNWPGDSSIASLFKEAKAGDRFVVQFEDVALETKHGVHQRLDSFKLVQVKVKQ